MELEKIWNFDSHQFSVIEEGLWAEGAGQFLVLGPCPYFGVLLQGCQTSDVANIFTRRFHEVVHRLAKKFTKQESRAQSYQHHNSENSWFSDQKIFLL